MPWHIPLSLYECYINHSTLSLNIHFLSHFSPILEVFGVPWLFVAQLGPVPRSPVAKHLYPVIGSDCTLRLLTTLLDSGRSRAGWPQIKGIEHPAFFGKQAPPIQPDLRRAAATAYQDIHAEDAHAKLQRVGITATDTAIFHTGDQEHSRKYGVNQLHSHMLHHALSLVIPLQLPINATRAFCRARAPYWLVASDGKPLAPRHQPCLTPGANGRREVLPQWSGISRLRHHQAGVRREAEGQLRVS